MKEIDFTLEIKAMQPEDWDAIKDIYEKGIATGNATFQTSAPSSWDMWNQGHLPHSRFVAITNNKVVAWTALSPTSKRECYKGVCELSIYVDPVFGGKGIGNLLMQTLISSSEENGVWSLYSSTFPENKASIGLQKEFGFREIGYREKIAQQNGVWRDTLLLERRSNMVGI